MVSLARRMNGHCYHMTTQATSERRGAVTVLLVVRVRCGRGEAGGMLAEPLSSMRGRRLAITAKDGHVLLEYLPFPVHSSSPFSSSVSGNRASAARLCPLLRTRMPASRPNDQLAIKGCCFSLARAATAMWRCDNFNSKSASLATFCRLSTVCNPTAGSRSFADDCSSSSKEDEQARLATG